MGCLWGMSTIRYTSIIIYARFSGQFFQKMIVNDCAVYGCNDDRLFPEKYTLKFPFPPPKRV